MKTRLRTRLRSARSVVQSNSPLALTVCLLIAGLLLAGPSVRGARGEDVAQPDHPPVRARQQVQRALVAVNTHQPQAMAPFAASDAAVTFAWTRETTTKLWSAGLLSVPREPEHGAEASDPDASHASPYLAVFHAWHACQSDGDHIHSLLLTPQGWRLGPEIPETDTGGFRVRDHDLHVTLDVPRRTATIRDTARIERAQADARPYCLLRLNEGFGVQTFTCDGRKTPFQQAGGVLLFTPPAARSCTVGLSYSGLLNHEGGDYILRDEATLNSYWYPNIARLPATATVTVTAPPGWIPLAQGEPIRQTRGADGAITATYRNDLPVSYFTVDLGRYHVTTRKVGGRHLTAYLLRDDPAFAARCLDRLARALRVYEACFARFPYTRYGLVESRGPFDGALEAYSFATFEAKEMWEDIPHELAHTWWGGLVPCTYTRAMWDEAFADYSDHLYQRLSEGSASRPTTGGHLAYGRRFDAYPLAAAYDTSDGRQSRVGYGKGSLVLRVLEEELGREMLLRCMAAFVAAHPRGEAAEWAEFERVVRRVTSHDYGWFFAQWIGRIGLPTLRLNAVGVRQEGAEYLVEGDIEQAGTPYRLRVPLALHTRDGATVHEQVQVEETTTHFILRARSIPLRLTLDPANILPLTNAESTTVDLTLRAE